MESFWVEVGRVCAKVVIPLPEEERVGVGVGVPSLEMYKTVCVGVKRLEEGVSSFIVLVDEVTVTSTSLVLKIELVKVTESPVSIDDDKRTELLMPT